MSYGTSSTTSSNMLITLAPVTALIYSYLYFGVNVIIEKKEECNMFENGVIGIMRYSGV